MPSTDSPPVGSASGETAPDRHRPVATVEVSGPIPTISTIQASVSPPEPRPGPQPPLEILIIEDSEPQARRLARILSDNGYRVTTARDGREGLMAIETLRPAVVITDAVMPRLDGFEVCRRIKDSDNLGDIPVILLCSAADPSDVLKGLQCGADLFVSKPYEDEALLSCLRSLADRSASAAEDRDEVGLELNFAGRKHLITPERAKILDQLIRSYEISLEKNTELLGINRELATAIERIRHLEENQRAILDSTGDGMIVVNSDWIVLYVNPAAETLLDQSGEELSGAPLCLPLDEQESSELEISRSASPTVTVEVRIAEVSYQGETAHLVLLHDITERKRAEQEVERVQREHGEMRERFLSHVSHELRSPLASIHNFVQLLLRGLGEELSDEYRQYLEATHRNTVRLRDMIEELVEATRAQNAAMTVEPARASIEQILEETLAGFGLRHKVEENGIDLTVELPEDLPMAFVDPARVRQVFTNLIENAVKFTPPKGLISVHATTIPAEEEGGPGFVRVAVSDTGCGMREEDCARIFERMYQIKPHDETTRQGIGLGLYICKELVTRHGGKIWAESRLGEGSTFFFTLPIFSTRLLLGALIGPEQVEPRGTPTLLAVDIHRPAGQVLHPGDERFLNATHRVLADSTQNSSSILLPRFGKSDCGEVFLILAVSEEGGAESLQRQVEVALHGERVLDTSSLVVSFSYDTLDAFATDRDGSLDQFLLTLETHAEDLIEQVRGPKEARR